jgi:hypothetical protein
MAHFTPDSFSQKIAFIAVGFGVAALVLTCVGLATPRWYSDYFSLGDGTYVKTNSANFFYACTVYPNGTLLNCTNRGHSLFGYSTYSAADPWKTGYYQRMQNAGALCIVGIIFLFLGTLTTLIMTIVYFQTWVTIIPPALLFLASLFLLAGRAEGSRYLFYNDYSANLYQTGHLLTMLTLFLSAFTAGRIHFSRWTESGKNTT